MPPSSTAIAVMERRPPPTGALPSATPQNRIRSVSTSLPSDHASLCVRTALRASSSLIALIALGVFGIAIAASAGERTTTATVEAAVERAVAASGDMVDAPARVTLVGRPTGSGLGSEGTGAAAARKPSRLVLSAARFFYLDINGDDRMDVVHDAMVKSNTGDFRVEVAIVYLSSPSAPAGYCHSAAASAALAPADLASVAAVGARLATEKKRLGIAGFGCER